MRNPLSIRQKDVYKTFLSMLRRTVLVCPVTICATELDEGCPSLPCSLLSITCVFLPTVSTIHLKFVSVTSEASVTAGPVSLKAEAFLLVVVG